MYPVAQMDTLAGVLQTLLPIHVAVGHYAMQVVEEEVQGALDLQV